MKLTTLVLYATIKFCLIKSEDVYPDIQDLFPKTSNSEIEPIRTLDIDIERIDLDEFKQKLEKLESQVAGNETRRQQFYYFSNSEWKRASNTILKVKALDLMLQSIYMARHRVRQLESEKHFNKTDTGYRVAFLYQKLRKIRRLMMDYHTMMSKKVYNRHWYSDLNGAMKMHLRVIKLYEDFQYLYWVLIAIDGKFLYRQRTTTAAKTKRTEEDTRATRTRTTTVRSTLGFGVGEVLRFGT